MNISVNNLDLGYEQCAELNNLVRQSGENLLQNLATNINNLKAHWIGSDATTHINNLIVVYNELVSLLTEAKAVTASAGEKIIALQEVRKMNGGSVNVGSPLSSEAPSSIIITNASETSEYFVDPAASSDYAMLQEECTSYVTFIGQFERMKDELLQNWTAGANREEAVNTFNSFTANSEMYNKYLLNAKENLGIAVGNISQL